MLVRRISPAPSPAASRAHPTASRPVAVRPPCVYTSHRPSETRRASIATTMHWLPNRRAASRRSSGRWSAAVLIPTLSAPAVSIRRRSSTVLRPPPTVNGIVSTSAVRRTTSSMMPRRSWLAVMSRKITSSAPSRSYATASSTGSPASRRLVKLVPLTTRPASTSRQGITRLASIGSRGGGQEFLQPHPPLVQRPADDPPLEPCGLELPEPEDVFDRSDPAGRDDRHADLPQHPLDGGHVR